MNRLEQKPQHSLHSHQQQIETSKPMLCIQIQKTYIYIYIYINTCVYVYKVCRFKRIHCKYKLTSELSLFNIFIITSNSLHRKEKNKLANNPPSAFMTQKKKSKTVWKLFKLYLTSLGRSPKSKPFPQPVCSACIQHKHKRRKKRQRTRHGTYPHQRSWPDTPAAHTGRPSPSSSSHDRSDQYFCSPCFLSADCLVFSPLSGSLQTASLSPPSSAAVLLHPVGVWKEAQLWWCHARNAADTAARGGVWGQRSGFIILRHGSVPKMGVGWGLGGGQFWAITTGTLKFVHVRQRSSWKCFVACWHVAPGQWEGRGMMHAWSCERVWSNLWSVKNVLNSTWVCVNEHQALFFFFMRASTVRCQRLLMNVCCNLNTEQRVAESLSSHSVKISTFFDSDELNPGWIRWAYTSTKAQ